MSHGLEVFMRIILVLVVAMSLRVQAQEVTRAQVQGLDEQVQEIKADLLDIASEISLLEEKLLYPSNSQVSLFVSLDVSLDAKENFSIDSIQIELDGKVVARHLYTFRELQALQRGGVQRIFTGNIKTGEHELSLILAGSSSGKEFKKIASHKLDKKVGPKFFEIALGGPGAENQGISFRDW